MIHVQASIIGVAIGAAIVAIIVTIAELCGVRIGPLFVLDFLRRRGHNDWWNRRVGSKTLQ